MDNFLTIQELEKLGLKSYGTDVLIGRHVVLYQPEKLEIGNHVRIDDFTVISGNVKLNNYIHISQFCGLYGGESGIVFEDYTGLSSKSSIYAVSDDYTGLSMTNPMIPIKYRPTLLDKSVYVRKHAIIGCSSVILPGVEIGEGAAVGSMSLCTKNVDAWSISIGVPARKVKERSKKLLKYEELFQRERDGFCDS